MIDKMKEVMNSRGVDKGELKELARTMYHCDDCEVGSLDACEEHEDELDGAIKKARRHL